MRKKAVVALGVLAMAAVTIGFLAGRGDGAVSYRFVTVTRGDVESTVSATGSLGAVSTVQVGTQVSGQVAEVGADFNDRVAKGQVIARIDPTLLEQQVREAEAGLERARADLAQKEYALDQAKALYDQKIVTEGEYRAADYNHTVSKANLVSAEAGLDRAERNLEYSVIYAPIDGIVVERNVEPGQTVAASLSAPQLFLIAEDLTNMQILVSVDESDIGKIEEGQLARFTVQAYPERTFEGTVRQVRLQSTSSENVVNYTVVVGVSNPDGTLLPGMTATVAFVLESAKDVLLVPNAALRFRASAGMQAEVQERMAATRAAAASEAGTDSTALADSGGRRPGSRTETAAGQAGSRGAGAGRSSGSRTGAAANAAQLWYVDPEGQLSVVRARTGLTDGQNTEISGGPAVVEGLQVIAGVIESGSAATSTATTTNPFQQQSGGPGRGRGGF
jgi:HlyD family secretion protein